MRAKIFEVEGREYFFEIFSPGINLLMDEGF